MTKEQATLLGNDMIAKLGKGWTLELAESDAYPHWTPRVYSPSRHLYVGVNMYKTSGKATYFCLMTADPVNHPSSGWTKINTGRIYTDPVDAVLDQVAIARFEVTRLEAAVTEVERAASQFVCPCCGKARTC